MRLRPATLGDVAVLATIHRLAAFVSSAHTPDEDQQFIRDRLMIDNEVWVAEADGTPAGYIAFNNEWVSHLFVHPERQGLGIGTVLLSHAMKDGRERQLWTFQKNLPARKFYEDRGWIVVELTDGEGNEEKEPDVRYVWLPSG